VNLLFGKRFEKMAMESADTISDIHGGGSPEAHRVTILRETDVEAKKILYSLLGTQDGGNPCGP
jgi:hypothetical protein